MGSSVTQLCDLVSADTHVDYRKLFCLILFSYNMQLKKMQQKNLKPYDSTLASLSITCSKALQLDLAEAFLNQISECLYPNPYNALLASCNQLVSSNVKVQNKVMHFTILLFARLKLVYLKTE